MIFLIIPFAIVLAYLRKGRYYKNSLKISVVAIVITMLSLWLNGYGGLPTLPDVLAFVIALVALVLAAKK